MSFNGYIARRRAKVVELYLAGETPGRIAATVGYSEQYVRLVLRQCGAMSVGTTGEALSGGRGRPKKVETPESAKAKKGKKK